MRIGVLTSSRADFGIYLPLLRKLEADSDIKLEIIAFGTHLSKFHGYSIAQIKEHNFEKIHEISSLLTNDDENAISTAFGLTALKFSDFWQSHKFDWVFCLGDRFEMAAAVQAGIPFGVKFAHLHGGETTLGAIDNIYRHQISLVSIVHFPVTDGFARRIEQLLGSSKHIYPVGSLSLDGFDKLAIPNEEEFRSKYKVKGEYALVTFHPETVEPQKNVEHAREMYQALSTISKQIKVVVTMPNADTNGTVYRERLNELHRQCQQDTLLIENFGKLNYFAAMRYCKFLLGNTSSGIIEAASFGKYVINVGDRQKGRAQSENIINTRFVADEIVNAVTSLMSKSEYEGDNVYYKAGTADLIIACLKNYRNEKL